MKEARVDLMNRIILVQLYKKEESDKSSRTAEHKKIVIIRRDKIESKTRQFLITRTWKL